MLLKSSDTLTEIVGGKGASKFDRMICQSLSEPHVWKSCGNRSGPNS